MPNTKSLSLKANSTNLSDIENKIHLIRENQVILDRDLASFYQVDLSQMNRQIKRNITRFPPDFRFQLTKDEHDSLKCQNGIANTRGGDRALPYAFTEQGVAMLSGLLRSETAINANILIMRAFVAMRRLFITNSHVFQRLNYLEYRQHETDNTIERIIDRIDNLSVIPRQGVFFDGQVFDAYEFACNLIRQADLNITLIDNYVNDEVLTILDKRKPGVKATIYTNNTSKQFALDITKHNSQYPPIDIVSFNKSHDRFLVIDANVYHFGASIKDLGKKWFAVSLLEDIKPEDLVSRIQ